MVRVMVPLTEKKVQFYYVCGDGTEGIHFALRRT